MKSLVLEEDGDGYGVAYDDPGDHETDVTQKQVVHSGLFVDPSVKSCIKERFQIPLPRDIVSQGSKGLPDSLTPTNVHLWKRKIKEKLIQSLIQRHVKLDSFRVDNKRNAK